MNEFPASVGAKKELRDALWPISRTALPAVQKSYDVELTYTSNATEGNTRTQRENGGTDRT